MKIWIRFPRTHLKGRRAYIHRSYDVITKETTHLVAGHRETKVELTRKLPPWLAFRVPEGAMQAAWGEKIWVVFLNTRPCRLQP